jgi:methyl-accepting chemotaxis protein
LTEIIKTTENQSNALKQVIDTIVNINSFIKSNQKKIDNLKKDIDNLSLESEG